MEVVNEAEEIQGYTLFDETADHENGQSRGASIGDSDHDGSSVDPFPKQT